MLHHRLAPFRALRQQGMLPLPFPRPLFPLGLLTCSLALILLLFTFTFLGLRLLATGARNTRCFPTRLTQEQQGHAPLSSLGSLWRGTKAQKGTKDLPESNKPLSGLKMGRCLIYPITRSSSNPVGKSQRHVKLTQRHHNSEPHPLLYPPFRRARSLECT